MMVHRDNFKKFLQEKHNWYKNIGLVYCPILKENIIFNAKGFYHLRYHSSNKERTVAEQIYKINLLPLVIPVIKKAKDIFEYKSGLYSQKLGKKFELWELRGVSGRRHPTIISVVLRRIGTGNITFLSVYDHRIKTKKPSQG